MQLFRLEKSLSGFFNIALKFTLITCGIRLPNRWRLCWYIAVHIFKAINLAIHLLTMKTKFQLWTVCVNILMLFPKVGVFDATLGYDVYVQSLRLSVTRELGVYLNRDLSDVNHVFPVDAYRMTTNTISVGEFNWLMWRLSHLYRFPYRKAHSSHL